MRAAHCRSTHHFFAIDAIPLIRTPAGERLARQLLRHHHRYLTGAKNPDLRFRDFHNHVVHVDDTLLSHYDVKAASANPATAPDVVSRDCLSQLIGLCVTGWSRVLERAAADAEESRYEQLPRSRITLALFTASTKLPRQRLIRWREYRREQKKVRAIVDEFSVTGEVVTHLPSEQRVIEKVCRIYDREREYNRLRAERQTTSDIRIRAFPRTSDPMGSDADHQHSDGVTSVTPSVNGTLKKMAA